MNAPDQLLDKQAKHESAHWHVQGLAAYVDDLPLTVGTLHAAPLMSNVAHGRIVSLDLSAVLAAPGVRAVVTADDVVGDKLLATFVHDEPIFASTHVEHIGQVLGVVVADSHIQARAAAALIPWPISKPCMCHTKAKAPRWLTW